MWTLLFIAALVLITFRMFVWHHEDRDRVPFEATLTDEDRARLHQLIERQLATGQKSLQVSGTVVSVSDRKCADVMHDAVNCQAQPLEPHGHGQRDASLQHKLGQITSGQVSGKKDEFGEWHVEAAELHRVYPAVAELSAGSDAAPRRGVSTEAALEAEIEVLIKRASNRLQKQLANMRDHRDAGRDQAQGSQRQLDEQERRPWWRHLAG
jgi:hypothetical protein